ncbi:type VI secretion system lipoprotein TssJ [Chromohalobacter sarecensis]|uniref:Type VI secretion system lipoprotein TssJ n=1 Tax=Chromohalobacter sarecensis TaxID=245294 RepID=A0ABV9D2D0_9GAMM|nr:type VI secretion system lipoprotein TssJ [Chromohalobacter sarecensis]MCK0714554.1 type VI secretion system lipoprotein TssJ [Chromohalobacter sarecensis]
MISIAGCGVADRVGNRFEGTWAGDLFGNEERVRVTVDADEMVNPDVDHDPLSVVVRIYQLSEQASFAMASPRALWSDGKRMLGSSLISRREITLMPNQQKVDTSGLDPKTQFIGVAAFYRNAVDDRWHVIFDADELRRDGLLSASEGIRLHLVDSRIEIERGQNLLDE